MHVFSTGGLVAAHRLPFGNAPRRLHRDGAVGDLLDELAQDRVGLHQLSQADDGAAVDVAVVVDDDLELQVGVGEVGVIAAGVAVHAGGAGSGPHRAQEQGVFL